MITLEEATKIAKAERNYFDTYEEYKNFYIFSWSKSKDVEGGWDSPIIVLKESGETKVYLYLVTRHPEWLSDKEFVSKGNC